MAGEPGVAVVVPVTEVTVGQGADLHLVTLNHWAGNVRHFGVERARIGRDSRFHWTFAAIGGKLVKSDMEIHLEGEAEKGSSRAATSETSRSTSTSTPSRITRSGTP